jgi:hypothetical protein
MQIEIIDSRTGTVIQSINNLSVTPKNEEIIVLKDQRYQVVNTLHFIEDGRIEIVVSGI